MITRSEKITSDNNYSGLREFFDKLNNNNIEYLILRGHAKLASLDILEDPYIEIDLLIGSMDRFLSTTNAKMPSYKSSNSRLRVIFIDDKEVVLDIREVGDSYYDANWQRNMLKSRMLDPFGNWYILDELNYYYSLAYHAILQKSSLSEEYSLILADISKKIGIFAYTEEEHIKHLDTYMMKKGYKYTIPDDPGVLLRFHGRDSIKTQTKNPQKMSRLGIRVYRLLRRIIKNDM